VRSVSVSLPASNQQTASLEQPLSVESAPVDADVGRAPLSSGPLTGADPLAYAYPEVSLNLLRGGLPISVPSGTVFSLRHRGVALDFTTSSAIDTASGLVDALHSGFDGYATGLITAATAPEAAQYAGTKRLVFRAESDREKVKARVGDEGVDALTLPHHSKTLSEPAEAHIQAFMTEESTSGVRSADMLVVWTSSVAVGAMTGLPTSEAAAVARGWVLQGRQDAYPHGYEHFLAARPLHVDSAGGASLLLLQGRSGEAKHVLHLPASHALVGAFADGGRVTVVGENTSNLGPTTASFTDTTGLSYDITVGLHATDAVPTSTTALAGDLQTKLRAGGASNITVVFDQRISKLVFRHATDFTIATADSGLLARMGLTTTTTSSQNRELVSPRAADVLVVPGEGTNRHRTTYHARNIRIPTDAEGHEGKPAVALFATRADAVRIYGSPQDMVPFVADLGHTGFPQVLDVLGRSTTSPAVLDVVFSADTAHTIRLENDRVLALPADMIDVLEARDPSPLSGRVMSCVGGTAPESRISSGMTSVSELTGIVLSNASATETTMRTVYVQKLVLGGSSYVALFATAAQARAQVHGLSQDAQYRAVAAGALDLRATTMSLSVPLAARGMGGTGNYADLLTGELVFSRGHGYRTGDAVLLSATPPTSLRPYVSPSLAFDATVSKAHFFDSMPNGAAAFVAATGLALSADIESPEEEGAYAVVVTGDKRLRLAGASGGMLDFGLWWYYLAATAAFVKTDAGADQGRIRISRVPQSQLDKSTDMMGAAAAVVSPWRVVYLKLEGMSAGSRGVVSTDDVVGSNGAIVVPVARQLCNQHLVIDQTSTVPAIDRDASLHVLLRCEDDTMRSARFSETAPGKDDADLARIDIVLEIASEPAGGDRYRQLVEEVIMSRSQNTMSR
jgi:hypothetical protein